MKVKKIARKIAKVIMLEWEYALEEVVQIGPHQRGSYGANMVVQGTLREMKVLFPTLSRKQLSRAIRDSSELGAYWYYNKVDW